MRYRMTISRTSASAKNAAAACNNVTTQCGGCKAHTDSNTAPSKRNAVQNFFHRQGSQRTAAVSERPVLSRRKRNALDPQRGPEAKSSPCCRFRALSGMKYTMAGRDEGNSLCQRHARSGRFERKTNRGTNKNGPFKLPSVLHDCLRSTCRRRTEEACQSDDESHDCRPLAEPTSQSAAPMSESRGCSFSFRFLRILRGNKSGVVEPPPAFSRDIRRVRPASSSARRPAPALQPSTMTTPVPVWNFSRAAR